MQFYHLVKNSNIVNHIINDKHKGNLSHNYIIYASSHKDIAELMVGVAMAIMCDEDGCGNCEYCSKILANSFTDVYLLPEKADVNMIEDLIENCYYASGNKKGYKIYLIPYCDDFFGNNQNKLLKVFEEPPEGCIFLLGATSEAKLLPTIKSRSVKLTYIPNEDMVDAIQYEYPEFSKTQIELSLSLNNGSFSQTIEWLNDNFDVEESYDNVINIFQALDTSKNVYKLASSDDFSKDNINLTLNYIEILFKELLAHISGCDNLLLVPEKINSYNKIIEKGYNINSITMILCSVTDTRQKLKFNCLTNSVACSLLMNILEVKYKCKL